MIDGMVKLLAARFLALVWHFVATCALFYEKVPLIQIELDLAKTEEERMKQYQHIDTW